MLTINGLTGDSDHLWFTTKEIAGLFEYDFATKKSKLLVILDEDNIGVINQFGVIRKYRHKLYIAPIFGDYLCIYDLKSGSLNKIELFRNEVSNFRIRSVVQYENIICFVGCNTSTLITVNCECDEVKRTDIGSYFGNEKGNSLFAASDREIIRICREGANEIVEYNLLSSEISVSRKNIRGSLYGTCLVFDECIYISADDETVWVENDNRSTARRLELPQDFRPKNRNYSMVVNQNNNVYIMPFEANMLLKYSRGNNRLECLKKYDNPSGKVYMFAGEFDKNHLWGFNVIDNMIDIIDSDTGVVEKISIQRIDGLKDVIKAMNKACTVITEMPENGIDLEAFIEAIV